MKKRIIRLSKKRITYISFLLIASLLIQLIPFYLLDIKVFAQPGDDDSIRSFSYPGTAYEPTEHTVSTKYRRSSSSQSTDAPLTSSRIFDKDLMIDGLNVIVTGSDTSITVNGVLYLKNGAKISGDGRLFTRGKVIIENGCEITIAQRASTGSGADLEYNYSDLFNIVGTKDDRGNYIGTVEVIPNYGFYLSDTSDSGRTVLDKYVIEESQGAQKVYFCLPDKICFRSSTIPEINISRYAYPITGDKFILEGTKSEIGDYYISDVTLRAPMGYYFSIKGETNSDGLPVMHSSKVFTETVNSFEINLFDEYGRYVEGPIDGTVGDFTVPKITINKSFTEPEVPYTLTGTKYKDKFFQSDVTLKPAEGYKVYTPDMIKADKRPVESLKYTSTTKDVKIVLVDPDGFTSDEIKVGDIMILREDKGKIEADDCYLGGKLTVKVSADKRDPKLAKITYKDSEGKELKEAPSEIGKYTVIATFPDDDNYQEYVAKDDFEIKYLPTPTAPYSIEGTKGENEFYTTDVKIIPAEGYKISTTIRTGYTDSIALDKNGNLGYVYLQKKSTGEMTDKIAIKEIMIDKDLPVVTGISNNEVIYTDSRQIIVRDDNLEEVSVNGVKVGVSNGQAVIDLSADNGIMDYTIIMTDKAGHTSTIYVTLITAWMKEGSIQEGVPLKLYPGYTYNFPEGSTWTIDGDPTVYKGGNKFVVNNNVEIKFKKN